MISIWNTVHVNADDEVNKVSDKVDDNNALHWEYAQ